MLLLYKRRKPEFVLKNNNINLLIFSMKQTEAIQARIAEDLHEMDKPMARGADDQDLEVYLKNREREEDPMLQYMRKKKEKQSGAKSKNSSRESQFYVIIG